MTTKWIVKRAGVEKGPFTSAQLKSLAAKGKLKPDDQVRKDSGENFYNANQVTGLFPAQTPAASDAGVNEFALAPLEENRFEELPIEEGPSEEVPLAATLVDGPLVDEPLHDEALPSESLENPAVPSGMPSQPYTSSQGQPFHSSQGQSYNPGQAPPYSGVQSQPFGRSENKPFNSGAKQPFSSASREERTMGMLLYILGAFTGFIGPLILWLIKRGDSEFIDEHGKNVLNLSITMAIISVLTVLFSTVLSFLMLAASSDPMEFAAANTVMSILIFLVSSVIYIGALVYFVTGAIEANKGARYEFPYCFRFF